MLFYMAKMDDGCMLYVTCSISELSLVQFQWGTLNGISKPVIDVI